MFRLGRRRVASACRSELNLRRRAQPQSLSLGSLCSFSGSSSCGYVDARATLAQETAATIRKDGTNFRYDRESDFFRRFAADIESSRRVKICDARFEIVRSIFAEPRQQFGVTLSWPEQANVAESERQKSIQREEIATKIV